MNTVFYRRLVRILPNVQVEVQLGTKINWLDLGQQVKRSKYIHNRFVSSVSSYITKTSVAHV